VCAHDVFDEVQVFGGFEYTCRRLGLIAADAEEVGGLGKLRIDPRELG
jgi:hypothetical protein